MVFTAPNKVGLLARNLFVMGEWHSLPQMQSVLSLVEIGDIMTNKTLGAYQLSIHILYCKIGGISK